MDSKGGGPGGALLQLDVAVMGLWAVVGARVLSPF